MTTEQGTDQEAAGVGIYWDVEQERRHAVEKYGAQSMAGQHWSGAECLAILVEQVGHVTNVLNSATLGQLDQDQARDGVRRQLISVAAMAVEWAKLCDRDQARTDLGAKVSQLRARPVEEATGPVAYWTCALCEHESPHLLEESVQHAVNRHNRLHHDGRPVAILVKVV